MNRSPLKWAGGKSRLMPKLLEHLPESDCLIEPFMGSGTVFMNTNYRRYILCDSCLPLIHFFGQLVSKPKELIRHAQSLFGSGSNTPERYYFHRAAFNDLSKSLSLAFDDGNSIGMAALFLYLNRHCYNGLYRTRKDGGFNVPLGKYAAPYFPAAEMLLFAEKARDTSAVFIYGDFRDTIPSSLEIEPDAVIYCDPPYIPASDTASFTTYGKPFTLDDHRDLVNALLTANHQHGTRPVISNSDTPETREIYHPFRLHEIEVQRSVGAKNRGKAGEVIGTLKMCEGCGSAGGGTGTEGGK